MAEGTTGLPTDASAVRALGLYDATTGFFYHLRRGPNDGLVVDAGAEYESDTASTATDRLILIGAVRSDTPISLVDADGKRTALQVNAEGLLYVAPAQIVSQATAVTFVPDTTSPTTALSANDSRVGATFENTSSAVCYLLCDEAAGTPSATNFTKRLEQYDYYELPYGYTEDVRVIWASDPADGGLAVTEFS